MRSVLPICAGLVVISGIVSATMWHDLRTERQTNADLRTQLADANSRLHAATLGPQRNSVQQAPAVAPTATISPTSNSGSKAPDANVVALRDALARENELMADPEYRKASLAQRRSLYTEMNYPELAEELGLSPKEADRFLNMLTEMDMLRDNQMMIDELNAKLSSEQLDPAVRDETGRKQQALEEGIAELLGPGRYVQWQEYQQTAGARRKAHQFGSQLALIGLPLSDAQQRALTAALISDQKRQQLQAPTMLRGVTQADPQARLRLREDVYKLEAESQRHTLDVAATYLNARQIASLRRQSDANLAMNLALLREERKRLETQASGQAP